MAGEEIRDFPSGKAACPQTAAICIHFDAARWGHRALPQIAFWMSIGKVGRFVLKPPLK